MSLNANRLALKLLRTNQKWAATSRSLSNSVFMGKNRGEISSAIQINAPTKRFISTSVYKSSNATPSESSGTKLMLMDMPRSVFPNIFSIIALRLKIGFQMFQLDKSFRFDQFLIGAEQVSSCICFLNMLTLTKAVSYSITLKGSHGCL